MVLFAYLAYLALLVQTLNKFQEGGQIDSSETSYLESKNVLNDYILNTEDVLNIEFLNIPELSGLFSVDEQGEIYFERKKYTYIRSLTIKELTQLIERRYKEFLLNPEVYIRIKHSSLFRSL